MVTHLNDLDHVAAGIPCGNIVVDIDDIMIVQMEMESLFVSISGTWK